MSQSQKKDIADFFRPYAKTIPRKRPTPDLDDDTIVVRSDRSTPSTPVTSRKFAQYKTDTHRSPSRPTVSPLATPKTGRSVSIAIRSPVGASTFKPASGKKPLFESPTNGSQDTPKPSTSFSFADAPATSRKVVEHGNVVEVRDSDDSDNESLQSLTDILSRKPEDSGLAKSSQTDASSKQEEERRSLLSLYTGGRSNPILKKDRLRDLHKLEQANRFDLSGILDDDRKDEARRAVLAKANAELEETTKELEDSKRAEMDKKMLAAILSGNASDDVEPEEYSRLMSAVDRTEAFAAEKTFSFFRAAGPRGTSSSKKTKKQFPASSIPASLWQPKDTAARDRAYLSGFVSELAGHNRIDDDALRWTFDSVLLEAQDDLRQTYIDTITIASSSWTRSNVTPDNVQSIFDKLGADPHALRDGTPVEARYHLNNESRKHDYKQLLIVLRLMKCICADMDFATLSKLTSITSRMSLDVHLMSNKLVCHAVESLLNELTDLGDTDSRSHVHERLLSDLGANLTEPTLQSQFLAHFIPTSPSAAELRCRLASSFLFGADHAGKLLKPQTSTSTSSPLIRITNTLSEHPLFTTTKSLSTLEDAESYSTLMAQTAILDAAIGDGFHPASFRSRSEQQIFNADVDTLADHIHALSVNIADTGASHMRRTEAKDALQALHFRLLYQVRTKPRRKRHVFDRDGAFSGAETAFGKMGKGGIADAFEVEGTKKSGEFMNKFLKKKVAKPDDLSS
ncbi:hypothetical protein LTR70_008560 [Exophiala xenobiotica]|uniref:Uncharacterized protein n=1 Tax=Lithohypha guttulata TaxID=1690604 RepID=A0ABR0K0S4_9EURO|nr:hypothetical protein LTR24_008188 [Lithohypha guttulata]KAK5311834.1 hypothetical protein LTR70_008560 [Exophiala xenobiotica]